MKVGIVFLPDGRADLCVSLDDEVKLDPYSEWSREQVAAFDDLIRDFPVTSRDPDVQCNYLNMRLAGESHNMAEMLATRRFPGIKTDSIFNEGKFSGDDGRIDAEQIWLRQRAEAVGVSTSGKWYCRGLADFPGDPTAWIGDRGDVLRVAREKHMKVHGYVEHDSGEREPIADVLVADDIVDECVEAILEDHPLMSPEEARGQAIALRTGAVDPNELLVKDYTESDLNVENW